MSKEDQAHTAILLPGARVALFTRDHDTRSSFMALENDWRYARVALEVHEGDVDTAIGMYQGTGTPDLVIVQTDNIDEGFSGRLETLSGLCSEGTAAIVIGPVNDVNLYRKLVGMGVSDYLVKPISTEQLGNEIAATLIQRIGATDSRIIAFIGSKGGVGTTSLIEALAWSVSGEMGQKTFLLDAAGGWSSLSVGLDFEPATTLGEAVRAAVEGNKDSLSRMMFNASDKLTVLSSGGDVMLEDVVSSEGFELLLDHMMVTYPVMLIDLSASPAALRRTVLTRAHEIVVITTPTLPAVRAARTLLLEIKQIRGGSDKEVDVIVNMTGLSSKNEVSKTQIEQGLERKNITYLPFDPDLFLGIEGEAGKLTNEKEGAAIVNKLMPMAAKVLGTAVDSQAMEDTDGKKGGGLGSFLTKLKAKS